MGHIQNKSTFVEPFMVLESSGVIMKLCADYVVVRDLNCVRQQSL